ncbi:MAG: HD domain-containing protein [Candidatus Eremiobacteraeota bacterium]|nr:HD domain-containing protein [Candidatus Eremiobacteraeota bacterium]
MAVAGNPAGVASENRRGLARQAYYVLLGVAGVCLLVRFPPHFDLRASTIVSVVVVAAFLVVSEWPHRATGKTTASLTAVIGACAVLFGTWTLVLALLAVTALRLRARQNQTVVTELFSTAYAGQLGLIVIATYCMLGVWHGTTSLVGIVSPAFAMPLTLLGIIAVGLVWQAVNNLAAALAFTLAGVPAAFGQLFRVGIVASIYSYLLVALYSFGGIVAAALFYIVVASTRILQDVVGITARLEMLDQAKAQGRHLVRDLIRLTDVGHVQFASEVRNISEMVARRLGMAKAEVELVGLAAELHELGKCRLPATVRQDIGLNPGQQASHRSYSRLGGIMVRNFDALLPAQIADWIEFHSEDFGGGGYPRGLAGEAIPLPARIIRLARDYVRLLTGHDGESVLRKDKALASLRERCPSVYDPDLVDLLCRSVD